MQIDETALEQAEAILAKHQFSGLQAYDALQSQTMLDVPELGHLHPAEARDISMQMPPGPLVGAGDVEARVQRRINAMFKLLEAQSELAARGEEDFEKDPIGTYNRVRTEIGLEPVEDLPPSPLQTFGAGFTAGTEETGPPVVGGFKPLFEFMELREVIKRVEEGEETTEDIEILADTMQRMAESSRDAPWAAGIGKIMGGSLPWIAEFAIAGGALPIAKKAAVKTLGKAADDVIEFATKRGYRRLLTEPAARAPLMPGRVVGAVAERRKPKFALDPEQLEIVSSVPDEAFVTSLALGGLDVYTEVLSEMLGGAVPGAPAIARRIGLGEVKAQWLERMARRVGWTKVKEALGKFGVQGVITEVGEEYAKDVMDEVLGIREVEFPDARELSQMFAAFSILPVGGMATVRSAQLADSFASWLAGKPYENLRSLAEKPPTRKTFREAGFTEPKTEAERQFVKAIAERLQRQTISANALQLPPGEVPAEPELLGQEMAVPEPPSETRGPAGGEIVAPPLGVVEAATPVEEPPAEAAAAGPTPAAAPLVTPNVTTVTPIVTEEEPAIEPEARIPVAQPKVPPGKPIEVSQKSLRSEQLKNTKVLKGVAPDLKDVMGPGTPEDVMAAAAAELPEAFHPHEWAQASYVFERHARGRDAVEALRNELVLRGLTENQAKRLAKHPPSGKKAPINDQDYFDEYGPERLADAILAYRGQDPGAEEVAQFILQNPNEFGPEELRAAVGRQQLAGADAEVAREVIGDVEYVEAGDLAPGDTFTMYGVPFEVSQVAGYSEITSPIMASPVLYTTDIPILLDAGSLDATRRTGLPLREVRERAAAAAEAAALEGAPEDFNFGANLKQEGELVEQEERALEGGAQLLLEGGAEQPAFSGEQRELELGVEGVEGELVTPTGAIREGRITTEEFPEPTPDVAGQEYMYGNKSSKEDMEQLIKDDGPGGIGGASRADAGDAYNLDVRNADGSEFTFRMPLRAMEMPEIVELAHNLLGHLPSIRKHLRGARGRFSYRGDLYTIILQADTAQNPEIMARVLAHEIGHLDDYLPDQTLARGNIGGRIAKLKKFLKQFFSQAPFDPAKTITKKDRQQLRKQAKKQAGKEADKEDVKAIYSELLSDLAEQRGLYDAQAIKDELWELSKWWKPLGPKPGKKYLQYRQSSPELYADAMSVLINSPKHLEEMAPTFHAALMDYMDRHTPFMEEYLALQRVLQGDNQEIAEHRSARWDARWDNSDQKTKAVVEAIRHERLSVWGKVKLLFTYGMFDTLAPAKKVVGQAHSRERARVLQAMLDELHSPDNDAKALIDWIQRYVYRPMKEAGITDNYIDTFMVMRRIYRMDGQDRAVIANPGGEIPRTAARQLVNLRRKMGRERFNELRFRMRAFNRALLQYGKRAVRSGVFSANTFNNIIRPNWETYATFQILKHFDGHVVGSMRHQIGTFEDPMRPFQSTIMKLISMDRLTRLNQAKRITLDSLGRVAPGDVLSRQRVPMRETEPKKKTKKGYKWLVVFENGTKWGYEVPDEIVDSFQHPEIGTIGLIAKFLGWTNRRLWHPLYITLSPSFWVANLPRDFWRTWRNLAIIGTARYKEMRQHLIEQGLSESEATEQAKSNKIHLGQVMWAWAKNLPRAKRYAWGNYDREIERAIREKAMTVPFVKWIRDPDTHTPSDSYELMLGKFGWEPTSHETENRAKSWAGSTIRFFENMTALTEGASKLAGLELLKTRDFRPMERSMLVRKYVGTPDFKMKGGLTPLFNRLLLFSRVRWNGMLADYGFFANPKTRSSALWRAATFAAVPTVVVWAARHRGLFGEDVQAMLKSIPDYFFTAYDVFPFGPDPDDPEKTRFLTFPVSDTGGTIRALTWQVLQSASGDRDLEDSLNLMVKEVASELIPNTTGIVDIARTWWQWGQGINPVDRYFGEPIVPKEQWEAGGSYRLGPLLKWTANKFGVIGYATNLGIQGLMPEEDRTDQTTWEVATKWSRVIGVGRIIRVSGSGNREDLYAESDKERKAEARFRQDWIPPSARRLTAERNQLRELPARSTAQEQRSVLLERWYQHYYAPLREQLKDMATAGRHDTAKQLKAELDRSSKELGTDLMSDAVYMALKLTNKPKEPPRPRRSISKAKTEADMEAYEKSMVDYQEKLERWNRRADASAEWLRSEGPEWRVLRREILSYLISRHTAQFQQRPGPRARKTIRRKLRAIESRLDKTKN